MYQPVSSLNLPTHLILKLEQIGFYKCNDVAENLDQIGTKIQIPEWKTATRAPKTKTALELCKEESNFKLVQSLIPELDSALQSMVHPGTITELCGFPGSGRTQICMHLAVGVQDVVFIHTNKNLSPDRLGEICEKTENDRDSIMEKIFCIEASNPVEIVASVEFLETWLQSHSIQLLLIDSFSWPLRQQEVSERTNLICTLLQRLRIMSRTHNFAIVLTNDLTSRPASGQFYTTSSLGASFFHLVNNRILLARNGEEFSASVLKSTNGRVHTVSFKI